MEKIDKFLTVAQVADMTALSRATVFQWAREGGFPKQKKFGTASRWSLAEIEAWIAAQPVGAYGEGGKS